MVIMYANTLLDPAMSHLSEAVFINNVENVPYDSHKSRKFSSCLGRMLLFRNQKGAQIYHIVTFLTICSYPLTAFSL